MVRGSPFTTSLLFSQAIFDGFQFHGAISFANALRLEEHLRLLNEGSSWILENPPNVFALRERLEALPLNWISRISSFCEWPIHFSSPDRRESINEYNT